VKADERTQCVPGISHPTDITQAAPIHSNLSANHPPMHDIPVTNNQKTTLNHLCAFALPSRLIPSARREISLACEIHRTKVLRIKATMQTLAKLSQPSVWNPLPTTGLPSRSVFPTCKASNIPASRPASLIDGMLELGSLARR
jgi:hypothetical protein